MTTSSSASRRDFLKQTAAYAALAVPTASVVGATRLIISNRSASSGASGLTLVSKGRSTYAIVVLPDAPLAAQHGAEELQDHLKAMSGARLPIVAHDEVMAHRLPHGVTPGHFITLGAAPAHAPLADDAFHIQTQGTQLAITGGGTRGTLYGCYALLEDVLGVRWFTPQCTHIPTRPTITLSPLNLHDAPGLGYRYPYWGEMVANPDWAARNRVNAVVSLDARVGGAVRDGKVNCDFPHLFPPKDYPQFWMGNQLCFSDPALAPAAVAKLKALIPTDPEAQVWAVAQDDNSSPCSCDSCQAILAEEGAPSGALLRFINAVADGIAPEFPHVVIETQAYQWSETPPKVTRARPNVRIQFAPLSACVAHTIGTCDKNRESYNNMVAWSKISQQLVMWHYSANFANYLQPLPDLTAMCGDIAVFHRGGGFGIFSEGDYSSGGGGYLSELKAYVQAKLMWKPARDGRAVIQEFVTGVYGPGAPFLQQWIDAVEAEVVPGNGHDERHAGIFGPADAKYLTDSLVARGVTLFDAAEQAAAQDPPALEQIRKARLALTYVQWQHAPEGSPERARYETLTRDTMKHFGITDLTE